MATTTRSDREWARAELLTVLDFLSELPAPASAEERAMLLANCEGIGVALVDFFLAEAGARVGDVRARHRYLRSLSELLDTPPDGSKSRDRARLASFRLVLTLAAMHLTTQAQREAFAELAS